MKKNISWMEYSPRLYAIFIATLFFIACDKKPSGIEIIQNITFPDPPKTVRVVVGDGQVRLEWSAVTGDSVVWYKIYRSERPQGMFFLLDSTKKTVYIDRRVQNGLTYYYQVSVVNKDGLESTKTAPVVAVPSVFAIAIENGAQFTGSRNVNIIANAPENTALIMLSNDSSFASAVWEPFQVNLSWTLSFGDGIKTVYAKFRSNAGVESYPPAKDDIILDTQAIIHSVTEDTKGQPKRAGDTIHFTLDAREPDGKAFVSIVGGPQRIKLFDDGTNGDKVANDGVYEIDYIVPEDVDVFQAKVKGEFIDRVQNVANVAFAETQITILKPPAPVTLFQPILVNDGKTAIKLSWSLSKDRADFAAYSVYQSTSPGVTDSNGVLINVINDINTTTTIASGLKPGTRYYFRVYVTDVTGLKAASNEVSASTTSEEAPTAVTVYKPLLINKEQVQLTWTQNTDNDFASYRIFRDTSPGVSTDSQLRAVLLRAAQTAFTDSGFVQGTTYYYKVYVFDTNGLNSASNEVSITIPVDAPPTPVILARPIAIDSTTLRLTWSKNNDEDFAFYSIYRSKTSPVDTTGAPIAIISSNPAKTEYTDVGLEPRTRYYYRVFVVDTGGLRSGSNEVFGETK